jgi:hypothetical protein
MAIADVDTQNFFIQKFLPELHEGIKNVNVSLIQKYDLFKKFAGVLVKLLYAFAF